jgi:3-methyladenine DNA glycosylase Mpg
MVFLSLLLTHYGQQASYREETFVSTALNVYQPIAWVTPLPLLNVACLPPGVPEAVLIRAVEAILSEGSCAFVSGVWGEHPID